MKVLKKGLFCIGIIFGVFISFFVLDVLRLVIHYQVQKKNYQDSFLIQGNTNQYVPQGLAYSNLYDVVLQTSYNANHHVSMLYVTNFTTGKVLKQLKIKELDQSDNLHHVGGIATDDSTVWITSDYEVNEYSLDEILHTKNDYIQSIKNQKLKIRGDFCTYYNQQLWIGDFFLNPFYPVKDNNPLLFAYDVTSTMNYSQPNIIFSLPKMVQGLTFNENGQFVFTTSFTNLISSQLLIYDDITKTESSGFYEFNHQMIPYYIFSSDTLVQQEKLPPMAEGLFYKDSSYYILFENSSDHYFYAFPKMKHVMKLHLEI